MKAYAIVEIFNDECNPEIEEVKIVFSEDEAKKFIDETPHK